MALIMFTPKTKKKMKLSWRGREKTRENCFICWILIHSFYSTHSWLSRRGLIRHIDNSRVFQLKPLNWKVKAIYQRHWAPAWLHHTSLSNPNIPLTTRLKQKSLVRCWCLEWPRTIWGTSFKSGKMAEKPPLATQVVFGVIADQRTGGSAAEPRLVQADGAASIRPGYASSHKWPLNRLFLTLTYRLLLPPLSLFLLYTCTSLGPLICGELFRGFSYGHTALCLLLSQNASFPQVWHAFLLPW